VGEQAVDRRAGRLQSSLQLEPERMLANLDWEYAPTGEYDFSPVRSSKLIEPRLCMVELTVTTRGSGPP
jgi:hypothetical protein